MEHTANHQAEPAAGMNSTDLWVLLFIVFAPTVLTLLRVLYLVLEN